MEKVNQNQIELDINIIKQESLIKGILSKGIVQGYSQKNRKIFFS